MMKIDPFSKDANSCFTDRQVIDTDRHKVLSACLLDSGVPGISIKVNDGLEGQSY